jgi:AcrR family transcriptional regulator
MLAAVNGGRKERKDKILSEAAKIFAEHSLHQTTMDQVAAHLGVNKVILYRYFASKEDLISSIFERVVEHIVKETDYQHPPRQLVGSGTLHAIKAVREYPEAFLMLVRHAPHDPLYHHYFEELVVTVRDHIEKDVESFMRTEGVPPKIVELSVHMGSTFGMRALTWWLENGNIEEDEYLVQWLSGAITTFLNSADLIKTSVPAGRKNFSKARAKPRTK